MQDKQQYYLMDRDDRDMRMFIHKHSTTLLHKWHRITANNRDK